MHNEVYTPSRETPNAAAPRTREPQRAGELLPELFRRYSERMAAAQAHPAALVDEHAAPQLGISIVAVKSAGRMVATGISTMPPAIAAPAAIQS